ncbi:type II toxin-antitoxin system RelE/ParE family toxin [Burkholderia sp. Ac-20379]|uniref:type II toxin-antitoxin system RelE/ParE family toxin n=1 Tax=Burkholderia sp. Ac-20379 TaxID=2703900 RepID=UPI0019810ED6|nr:type II toxin-antitoxin system RelE/ParE family toxin [Burkholderia sp. Ac-20379]MBN3728094.1 type II toxin-antitoxin system RelE/ParE family toxin [Burkholderia sp. Ac-20379]
MSRPRPVRFTQHFLDNLDAIEAFLRDADAPAAFDALLDELTDTFVPNLRRFPAMGCPFLDRPIRSIEVGNSLEQLVGVLAASVGKAEIREYVMARYLALYVHTDSEVFLLSIRHHAQLSFDFPQHWPPG